MPELQEKYETYDAKFAELTDLQNDEIIPLVNDIDEALYYRKLRGVQKKMNSLEEQVIHYAKESKQLLKDIEVITEIENIQRLKNIVLQMITMHRFVLKLRTTFLKYKMYFMILMNALLN